MTRTLTRLAVCALLAACSGAVVGADPSTTTSATTPVPASAEITTSAPTTTIPATTTTLIGAEILDGAMMAAWNRGDLETYWSFFAEDAMWAGMRLGSDELIEYHGHLQTIGWRVIAADCERHSETRITCRTTFANDISEQAGIEIRTVGKYWFNDEGLITSYGVSSSSRADVAAFDSALITWLESTYPDLAAQWNTLEDGYPDAAVCASVAATVTEFMNQSSTYPLGEEPVISEPTRSGSIDGIEVFNAGARQIHLVEWAIGRFSAAGIERPPVTAVTFPPTAACTGGLSGVTIHSDEGSKIDVCVESQDLADSTTFPCRARRTILHELGHVWNARVASESTRQAFLDLRGLDEWRAPVWQESGSEQAAEILMWGLLDQNVRPRVPDAECSKLHAAFEMLTGSVAGERLNDCTDN